MGTINAQEDIRAWFNQPIRRTLSDGDLLESFHLQHPSKVFLKNLPIGASVLDIGAGDGSLSIFKRWPSPARPDLRLYAFSLAKGEKFDDYDGYEIGDWNLTKPMFDNMRFDAIMCVNFIEHIDDPAGLIRWVAEHLNPGGHVYFEWPTDASRFCPRLADLDAMGFGCITGNYFDDRTHRKWLPSARFVRRKARRSGLSIVSAGVVSMPLMEDELLGHFRDTGDIVSLQFAYWLKTGWVQFLTATHRQRMLGTWFQRMKMILRRPPHQAALAADLRARASAGRRLEAGPVK